LVFMEKVIIQLTLFIWDFKEETNEKFF